MHSATSNYLSLSLHAGLQVTEKVNPGTFCNTSQYELAFSVTLESQSQSRPYFLLFSIIHVASGEIIKIDVT